jgi:uncharacterized protein GlcG (DUF336 family)
VKRTWTLFGVVAVTGAALSIAVLSRPGSATPPGAQSGSSASSSSTSPSTSAPPVVIPRNVLSLAAAQRLATAAQQDCAVRGFAVSVAVVDIDGVDILLQRADGTTGATVAVARGKAHAAVGFQSPTAGLNDAAKTNPGLISLPDFVILPGGEPVKVDNTVVAGVGVSGAPSGDIDDQCAMAGLAAIATA